MKRLAALILSAFALLVSHGARAAAPLEPDYVADAAILRRAYEALHPGLYRYNTPAQMEAHFADLTSALRQAHSRRDAFLAFARYTATVRCGHSYPNFFNQSDAVARELFQHQDRVPFYFEWIDGHMIVTRNFSGDPLLAPGTQILAINGTQTEAILAALLPLARADGSNDAKRIDQMAVRGTDRYEPFDVYFPMLFPQQSITMALTLKTTGGVTEHRSVSALSYDQRVAPLASALAAIDGGSTALWSFRALNSTTAYVKMPTWATYNSKWDWKASIDEAFADLSSHHTQRLVIDLRGNEGGTNVGDAILAHLIAAPLQRDESRRLVRYRSVPAALLPYLSTWDPSFKSLGADAVPVDDRFFALGQGGDDGGGAIAPTAPRFNGKVYVLVDASNSSATFQFDDAVQRNHLGTLIGTPTGGNQRGINGGAFFFVKLPNSGLEVDLPLIGTFPVQSRPDAGLTPDVLVTTTPADIAAGSDPQLQAVLNAR